MDLVNLFRTTRHPTHSIELCRVGSGSCLPTKPKCRANVGSVGLVIALSGNRYHRWTLLFGMAMERAFVRFSAAQKSRPQKGLLVHRYAAQKGYLRRLAEFASPGGRKNDRRFKGFRSSDGHCDQIPNINANNAFAELARIGELLALRCLGRHSRDHSYATAMTAHGVVSPR